MKSAVLSGLALVLLTGSYGVAQPHAAMRSLPSAIAAVVQRDRALYGGRTPVPSALVGVWGNGVNYVHARSWGQPER